MKTLLLQLFSEVSKKSSKMIFAITSIVIVLSLIGISRHRG